MHQFGHTPLTPTETQGAHFLFALEKGNWATAVTWTLPLPWGGLLTLKHPESVNDAEVTERNGHMVREGMMQVHLLLSRSIHGEVRLQQNTHFSTEKDGYSET